MTTFRSALVEHLRLLVDAYGAATGVGPGSIGLRALNDHKWIIRVLDGESSFSIRSFDRVVNYLALHWPPETEWPPSIPRPGRREVDAGQKPAAAPATGAAS